MMQGPSTLAIIIFLAFVGVTLGISFYFGRKAKSAQGYFAAHGQIPWFINGVAFAGDYLSAASFLGICGMIAFYGYDGFLYSIGYLAGWIVALFIIAEPMKRLGKFTFADALDSKYDSRGIRLVVGISTLAVSVFYLIPQMVGAGALIVPLLGFPHWVGVVIVGLTVIFIVVTAGMVSTTYVQFLKGFLLVFFSALLTWMLLQRGFEVKPGGVDGHTFLRDVHVHRALTKAEQSQDRAVSPASLIASFVDTEEARTELANLLNSRLGTNDFKVAKIEPSSSGTPLGYVWATEGDIARAFAVELVEMPSIDTAKDRSFGLTEIQTMQTLADKTVLINGQPQQAKNGVYDFYKIGYVSQLPEGQTKTGSVGPIEYLNTIHQSTVVLWKTKSETLQDGSKLTVYYPQETSGSEVLRPGEHPVFQGIRSAKITDKLNFLSLMLALFCGTASLPHILIRYYTVKDEASARKSTIVGIGTIGFFYILTLYLGLGAMTSGALDLVDTNMAAPLLARSISETLFAIISAIAFTTVLGTVSGLILASSGAVTHDILAGFVGLQLSDEQKVRVAKIAAAAVGLVAIALGILFKEMNVNYLVGWAFSVAASANLPALVMMLFWKQTTRQGIIASVSVGMISSLAWVLLSADTFSKVYGISAEASPMPFSQPGIVTIPLGFITLVVVTLLTRTNRNEG